MAAHRAARSTRTLGLLTKNRMRRFLQMLGFVCVAGMASGDPLAPDDPGMDFPIQLFVRACVASYSRAADVAAQASAMGLAKLNGDAAAKYLHDHSGQAWFRDTDDDSVALSLLPNGLCTVFVHRGEGERLEQGFKAWLPPADSGVTYTSEVIPSELGLTTTAYTISYRKGKKEMWVLTISSVPEALIRAIISYQGQ
jgi:hypothetical protein